MNFSIVHSFSNQIFYSKDSFLSALSPQQIKIARIALAIFCLIALTYYVASHYFTKTKITHDHEQALPSPVPFPIQEDFHNVSAEKAETESVDPVQESQAEVIEEIPSETPVEMKEDIALLNMQEEKEITEVDSVDPIVIPPTIPSTPYRASIALRTRGGGLVGSDLEALPYQFNLYDWKYKDGSDFLIQPNTLLLEFLVFFPSEEFQQLSRGSSDFELPSFLFTDKKEGDKIQLQYKGKKVELTLAQTAIAAGRSRKPEDNHFEDVFQCTVQHVLKEIDSGKLGFSGALYGRVDPLEGYTIDFGGTLFHAIHKDSTDPTREPYIIEADIKDFREIKALDSNENSLVTNDLNTEDKTRVTELEEMIIIQTEMCGIGKQVDIVLNEKFLCFYAREDISTPPPFKKIEAQYLRILRWKLLFENTTLEAMQNHIKNAKTKLAAGIFTITIPK